MSVSQLHITVDVHGQIYGRLDRTLCVWTETKLNLAPDTIKVKVVCSDFGFVVHVFIVRATESTLVLFIEGEHK